jgi:predicted nucleotidyltransferase
MADFHPTPDPELNRILADLLAGIRPILADNFLGAYLQGSFAHGGWDQDSDVDFIVVIDHPLSGADLSRLQPAHARLQERDIYWAHHLEGSYFPRDILGDLSLTDTPLDYLDNGSLTFERSTHDNSLVVRRVLRRYGVVLAGPPPETWIPPIPDAALRAEVRGVMFDWGGEILSGTYDINNGWAQPFAVLSYCRMLHTLATGDVHSKPAGAAWAKANLAPHWADLVAHAESQRENQYQRWHHPAEPGRVTQTKDFLAHALNLAKTRFGPEGDAGSEYN